MDCSNSGFLSGNEAYSHLRKEWTFSENGGKGNISVLKKGIQQELLRDFSSCMDAYESRAKEQTLYSK